MDQLFIDALPEATFLLDNELRMVAVNRAAVALVPAAAKSIGRQFASLLTAAARPRFKALSRAVEQSPGPPSFVVEVVGQEGAGGLLAELSLGVFEREHEQMFLLVMRQVQPSLRDDGLLALALERLAEAEAVFNAAFQHAPAGFAMSGNDGVLTSVNPAFAHTLGCEPHELVGRSVAEFTHPEDRSREAHLADKLISGAVADYAMEKRYVRKDGRIVPVLMHIARADVEGKKLFIAQTLDLTELRVAQDQLGREARLAALGRMAAAVAHDVNNPAAYLRLNLDEIAHLASRLPSAETIPRERFGELVADCIAGVERIGDIVRELQVLGRRGAAEVEPLSLREVVELSCRMADHEVRHRAALVLEPGDDAPWVEGDQSKLGQVVTNLVINAAKAIGGEDPGGNEVRVRCYGEDGQAVIEVDDTGPGLPDDYHRLFEPFVTGGASDGQGLGLWICAEIMRQHRGTLEAENRESGGARFVARLPLTEARAPREPLLPEEPSRGAVLVVDDDPAMLRAYRRALSRAHDLTLESSPEDALARLKEGERFDAIVCDMMMPQLSGAEFLARLEELSPLQASLLIFVTGGAVSDDGSDFLSAHHERVLFKPIRPRALRAAVGRLVSTGRGG